MISFDIIDGCRVLAFKYDIHGIDTRIMLDSGAEVCVICKALYDIFKQHNNIYLSSKTTTINSIVSCGNMKSIYHIKELYLGDIKMTNIPAIIVDKIGSCQFILSSYLFKLNPVYFDYNNKILSIDNTYKYIYSDYIKVIDGVYRLEVVIGKLSEDSSDMTC